MQVLGKFISQNNDNGGRSVKQGLTERKFNLVFFFAFQNPQLVLSTIPCRLKSDYEAIFVFDRESIINVTNVLVQFW